MRKPDYQRGDVALYLGDCTTILPELGAVDAVVTDPPYGIGFASQPTKWQRLSGSKPESWDESPADVAHLVHLAPIAVIWGGNYYSLPASRGWLTWFKPDAPPSMASLEFAWTSRDMNARQISHSISATNAERVDHPTQKPLRVMKWCMEVAGITFGSLVIDPYMGSGTTGVACIKTGRRFIGVEKEPKYFDLSVRRIERAFDDDALFTSLDSGPDAA